MSEANYLLRKLVKSIFVLPSRVKTLPELSSVLSTLKNNRTVFSCFGSNRTAARMVLWPAAFSMEVILFRSPSFHQFGLESILPTYLANTITYVNPGSDLSVPSMPPQIAVY